MNNLFTSYESPPPILTQEQLLDYLDLTNLEDMDFNPIEIPELDSEILEKPKVNQPTQNQSQALKVIDTARSFIGSKYSWGGSSPTTGFDCSGLLQYAFKQAGINLPRTAALQGLVGSAIDIKLAQPGDMIWFGSKNSPSGLHIGLVSKIENGLIYIIDAAGKAKGVVERALPNLEIRSVRRLFGNNSNFSSNNIINFFRNKGLSEALARGIYGNLMQESGGSHTAVNNSSGAYGLAQWLGPRKKALFLKYGSNPTAELQLEFIWDELNSTERDALNKLLRTTNVMDATKVFANNFERAGKNEMNMNRRIKFAYLA